MNSAEPPCKILIVDDEPDLLEIMSMRLQMEGFQTFTASSVSEALECLEKNAGIEVMVSDIRMPGENGIDLLGKLRDRDPKSPILFFLTGSLNLPIEEAFSQGAEGIFRKPVQFTNLVNAIRAAVARAQQFSNGRQHTRLEVDFAVQLEIPGGVAKSTRLRMSNLGRGGMFVRMDQGTLPDVGTALQFVFLFSDESLPRLEGEGKVVWVRQEPRDQGPRGMGIEFTSRDLKMDENLLTLLNSLTVRSYIPQG